MVAQGKVKGAPTPDQEERKKQYLEICTHIVPKIAQVIDEKGGFCSLSHVSDDSRVKQALATIPQTFSKKVKSVIDLFPDFISQFDGGRVATAKGYEEGLVNADGTVNPKPKGQPPAPRDPNAPKKEKKVKKEPGVNVNGGGEAGGATPGAAPGAGAAPQPQQQGPVQLMQVSKRLRTLCDPKNGTEEEFEAAYQEAVNARLGFIFCSKEEAINIIGNAIQVLVTKGKLPRIGVLAGSTQIQALQHVMGTKLAKFVELNPDSFIVDKEQGIVNVHPSLLSTLHQPQLQFSGPNYGRPQQQQMAPNPPTQRVPGMGKGSKKGGFPGGGLLPLSKRPRVA